MATTAPAVYLRFAADHCALLEDILRSGRVNDAELRVKVERHARPEDPSAGHVQRQLEELGFIEPAPEATAAFELTRPFAALLKLLRKRPVNDTLRASRVLA